MKVTDFFLSGLGQLKVWPGRGKSIVAPGRLVTGEGEATTNLANALVQLSAQSSLLDQLSSAVEDDFLGLGDQVEQLAGLSQTVQKEVSELMDLTIGTLGTKNIIAATMDLLREEIEVSATANQEALCLLAHLFTYQERIERLVSEEDRLLQCTATFTSIRMLFKIAVAPLPEEKRLIFYTLANDLEVLDQQVRETFVAQFTALRATQSIVTQTVSTLTDELEQHRSILASRQCAVEKTLSQLDGTMAANQKQHALLVAQSGHLAGHVSEIVEGLQFHDITHQRLDHVATHIRELCQHYPEIETASDQCGYLHEGCTLELEQTKSTLQQIHQAEERIREGFTAVNSVITGMIELLQNDSAPTKMIATLHREMEECSTLLLREREINAQTAQTILPMQGLAKNLTESLREISIRIHFISLNAEIQADQVGAGTGLEVISEQARGVSDETLRLSQHLSHEMEILGISLTDIVQQLEKCQRWETERSEIFLRTASELEAEGQELLSRHTTITSSLHQHIEQLHSQVMGLLGQKHFSTVMAPPLEALMTQLEAIRLLTASDLPAWNRSAYRHLQPEVSACYTMEAERQTLSRVVGTQRDSLHDLIPPLPPAASRTKPVSHATTELGANVELF